MAQTESTTSGVQDVSRTAQRQQIMDRIVKGGAVAIIRMDEVDALFEVVEAIRAGGITVLEITMTTPRALSLIEELAPQAGDDSDLLLGVGSVLDADTVEQAVDAGARFIVSPVFKPEVIEVAHRYGVPAIPGALSATEIQAAHEAGADTIKVFPASLMGTAYFKAVRAPLPHLKLMPTGGVTPENAGDWLEAGATVVGVGSALLDRKAIATGDFAQITEKARTLIRSIEAVRSGGG